MSDPTRILKRVSFYERNYCKQIVFARVPIFHKDASLCLFKKLIIIKVNCYRIINIPLAALDIRMQKPRDEISIAPNYYDAQEVLV